MGAVLNFASKLAINSRKKTTRPLSLGIVLVAWDRERTLQTLQLLNQHIQKAQKLGIESKVVVVCNNHDLLEEFSTGPHTAIPGSNTALDFSGYDEGMALLFEEQDLDAISLVNDRFLVYKINHFQAFRPETLDFIITNNFAAGEVLVTDAEEHPYRVFGREVISHLRTSFVVAPADFFRKIKSVQTIGEEELAQYIPVDFPGPEWLPSECINKEIAQFLMDWLNGQSWPWKWHRAEALTEANWPSMRAKLHTVFNEYTLPCRFEEEGLNMIGTTLATILAQLPPDDEVTEEWLTVLRSSPWPAINADLSNFYQTRLALAIAWRNFLRA